MPELIWSFILTRAFIQRYVPLMALVSRIYGMKHLKHVHSDKHLKQALSARPSFWSPPKPKAEKQR